MDAENTSNPDPETVEVPSSNRQINTIESKSNQELQIDQTDDEVSTDSTPSLSSIDIPDLQSLGGIRKPTVKCAPAISPDELEKRLEGADKYKSVCKYLNIVPISRVLRHLNTEILDLKHYGLSTKQMRAISETLTTNSSIKRLDLEDNWLTPDGASYLGNILRENGTIQHLNLQGCNLGPDGAHLLSEGLQMSQILQEINLSFNALGDSGMQELTNCLKDNSSIRQLNLAHNDLTEESAQYLATILKENKTLEDLNLSWNGFFTGPGNKVLFISGFLNNTSVKNLDISWNGIGSKPAARPIMKFLKTSPILESINLSYNRLCEGSLRMIRSGLVKSPSLQKVWMGNNIYTPEEAFFLATVLNSRKCPVRELDMENMTVQKDFLQLVKQIRKVGKKITYGHVLDNYVIKGPNETKLLFDRCRYLTMSPKKKKMKKDFGHFVLELPDDKQTKDDFKKAIKTKKVKKLDEDLVQAVVKRFVAGKKGGGEKIDCAALKQDYMQLYPDTVLPEKPPKKKKSKKKKTKKTKSKK